MAIVILFKTYMVLLAIASIFYPLFLTFGLSILRRPTSYIHAVVSRREKVQKVRLQELKLDRSGSVVQGAHDPVPSTLREEKGRVPA